MDGDLWCLDIFPTDRWWSEGLETDRLMFPPSAPLCLLGGGRSDDATMFEDLPLAMTAADIVTVSPNWTRVGMTELMMTFFEELYFIASE